MSGALGGKTRLSQLGKPVLKMVLEWGGGGGGGEEEREKRKRKKKGPEARRKDRRISNLCLLNLSYIPSHPLSARLKPLVSGKSDIDNRRSKCGLKSAPAAELTQRGFFGRREPISLLLLPQWSVLKTGVRTGARGVGG